MHDLALANARSIMAEARARRPTLMIGPLPVCDRDVDARIARLSAALAPLCASIGVPYLEVFADAVASPVWAREVAAGDGAHPNAGGYAVIATVVQRWPAWLAPIDVP